jgi:sarcosine oxidase subunit beta
MLDAERVKEFCPIINISPDVRYPVLGGALQRRGGTARHDRVAWGLATRASERGVDIVEHAEVTGFLRGKGGAVTGVETTRGAIGANKVALVAAGHTSVLASMVGLRLPVQSHPLQALVSALYEPVLNCVVMSNAVHVYVSQADKGEFVMGAGIDSYNGYGQRGSFHVIEHQMAAACELFPVFRHAALLRTWGGIVDICPDASPIIDATPIPGLFLNCGWGTGGFKATPGSGWTFAETVATAEQSDLAKPYALERFSSGALIDEHGAAGVAH